MNQATLDLIRDLIAEGLTNDQIQAELQELENDRLDALREAEEYRDMYGDPDDDHLTPYQKEMNDRLDMGRNEAGEWLGFM